MTLRLHCVENAEDLLQQCVGEEMVQGIAKNASPEQSVYETICICQFHLEALYNSFTICTGKLLDECGHSVRLALSEGDHEPLLRSLRIHPQSKNSQFIQ